MHHLNVVFFSHLRMAFLCKLSFRPTRGNEVAFCRHDIYGWIVMNSELAF